MPLQPRPSITSTELAELVDGRLEGPTNLVLHDVRPLECAGPAHVSFAVGAENEAKVITAEAGLIIVREGFLIDGELPNAHCRALIYHPAPMLAFSRAALAFRPSPPLASPGIHPSAVVDPSVVLGPGAAVGPLAVIEAGAVIGARAIIGGLAYIGVNVSVGEDSVICPHAVIAYGCEVGARCMIHSGAVVGSDGFGFAPNPITCLPEKIPQTGRVVLEDDVEVGANTTIDRATLEETRIANGVKIDNLVQIAHNVQIGSGSIIVAQAGIAGSSKLGRGVIVAAKAGISDHVEIGDHAVIGSFSGVNKNVPAGTDVLGQPAMPGRQARRVVAIFTRLPELRQELRRLEARLDQLER